MATQWTRWRLKSPASGLFTKPFVQAQIKENTKAPRHWPLWGEFRWQVNSPDKGPVTRKMFPFDDVIITTCKLINMKLQIMGNFYQTGQTKHFLKGFIPLMKWGSHVWYLWQHSRSQLLYKMCLIINTNFVESSLRAILQYRVSKRSHALTKTLFICP